MSHNLTTNPENPDAHLFEDTFPEGLNLTEILTRQLMKSGMESPLPIYALSGFYPYVSPDRSLFISLSPDSFLQPSSLGVDPEEIVAMAKNHYNKLRSFGMNVVGHNIEVVDPLNESMEVVASGNTATILTGAKFPFFEAWKPYTGVPQTQYPIYSDGDNYRALCKKQGIPNTGIAESIIAPLEQYLDWCERDRQDYVLSLSGLEKYLYHTGSGKIALQHLTAQFGSIELGNLNARTRDLGHLKAHLARQGIPVA